MQYQFADFDPAHFRAEPRRTVIGEWNVEHMSFGAPVDATGTEKPPLVFVGGAFQNAWSFLREVKHFLPQRPVIIVDLPGQGQNNQVSGSLTFADLADLLAKFCDEHGLQRIVPVGLSYGSGIAFTFAQRHPGKVDRLIIGGTTDRIRPRVYEALRRSFWYLDRGRVDQFAETVIHHLLNLPLRDVTGVSDRMITSLRAGMLELTDVELTRYRHNSARLFTNTLSGRVTCRTLVFTATYDHFTAPFEALAIANRCPNAEFAVIERGDHLAPVENPRSVIALYDAFLNDRPLSEVPGVHVGVAAAELTRERRMLARRAGRRRDVRLASPDGAETTAALLDYNAHGCLIEPTTSGIQAEPDAPVRVRIPAIRADGDAVLLPDPRGVRAVFLHDAFKTLGKMPVVTVELPAPAAGGRRMSIPERLAVLDR